MPTPSPAWFIVDWLLKQPNATLDLFSDTDATFGRMIFLDTLPLRLVTSGKRALQLTNNPGAIAAAFSTHAYSSTVQIRLYADHTRDLNGNAEAEDGLVRAWAAFGPLDQLLYSPTPIGTGDPMVQSDRGSHPMEGFDNEQDLPYIVVNYDVAVLASI